MGRLALDGIDPRRWDSHQLLAAFEASLQQSAKDEAEWTRTRARLYAEPPEIRKARLEEARQARSQGRTARRPIGSPAGMSEDAVNALLARMAASDAQYGAA